jgi:hypothetical protein
MMKNMTKFLETQIETGTGIIDLTNFWGLLNQQLAMSSIKMTSSAAPDRSGN